MSCLPALYSGADKQGMHRRIAITEVLDQHRIVCPRCRCPEAIVLIDMQFEVTWQCVDCESRWPASEEETALLLGPSMKTVH